MIGKILIEINRLKNELEGYSAKEGLDYIESYINTLSKQQVKEPDKSLEEAEELENFALLWASKRKSDYPPVIDAEGCEHKQYDFTDLIESFEAGWKCRDNQMPMPEDTVLFNKGVAEGRRLEREDMPKWRKIVGTGAPSGSIISYGRTHYLLHSDLDRLPKKD